LIEKHVFPVDTFGGEVLEDSLRIDAVFGTQTLPKLETDLIAALAQLQGYHFTWHLAGLLMTRRDLNNIFLFYKIIDTNDRFDSLNAPKI
jgi:hypothetical protein